MNTDIAAGKWKQLKGQIRAKWGKLTDDDLDQIAGERDQFVGVMQERYGIKKDQAEQYFDDLNKSSDDLSRSTH